MVDFRLIETMRVSESGDVYLLERHLDRLSRSAKFFSFRCDLAGTREAILQVVLRDRKEAYLRLTLGRGGDTDLELGGSTPPAEHSLSVIANDTPRTLGTPGLPTHQLAGQIVAAALAVQREEAQPIAALAAKPLASSVVKILHLELQPADLGTITIRMSLKQDALDIRVEASRYDTACMLQRDQDSLAKILTSAGYRIDGMTVVTAVTDGAAVSDGRSQAFLPSSTPQHGEASQQESRSSGGRPNAEPSPRSSPGKQNDDNDKSRTARGAGGDLYV